MEKTKNESSKIILAVCCGAFLLAVFFGGFTAGYFVGKSDGSDTARIAEYAGRSEAASTAVQNIKSGIANLTDEIQDAGGAVADGLTEVAEIREVGDRIADADGRIEDAAGRLEKSIYAVMRIIDQGEESAKILDGNGADDNGGGGN